MVDGSAAVVVAIHILREVQHRRKRAVDEAELRGAAERGPNEYVASSPGWGSVVVW